MRINIRPWFWMLTLFLAHPERAITAPYCTNVPPGEYRLVAPPANLEGQAFPLVAKHLPGIGFTLYQWDEMDMIWSPALPQFSPGEGAIVRRAASGGIGTLCFYSSSATPQLPLQLAPGFNLVSCQINQVAGFAEIVGQAPENGAQVYKFNTGPGRDAFHLAPPDYTIYTFADGAWSPGVPMADPGEAVFVYQPPWLATPRIQDGQFACEVKAPVNTVAIVEYSESLINPTWQTLTSVSGTSSGVTVVDNTGLNLQARRYYRVRLGP